MPTPTCAGLDGGSHVRAKARAVLAFPTPPLCGNYNRKGASANSGDGLATAVAKREGLRWPTPCATDANGSGGSGGTDRDRLDYAVERGRTKTATYPTPRCKDMCGARLNPDWVEWLMAWPVGWTDTEVPNDGLHWLDPSIDPADFEGEANIPRVTNRRDSRAARVKALGNGQFPLAASVAFCWGLQVLAATNGGSE